jgi:menin
VKDIEASGEPNPTIAALAAACSENILNPRFLLGQDIENAFTTTTDSNNIINPSSQTTAITTNTSQPNLIFGKQLTTNRDDFHDEKTTVTLSSQKIAGLKHLLLTDKFNTSAIQLQLRAQSHVNTNKR